MLCNINGKLICEKKNKDNAEKKIRFPLLCTRREIKYSNVLWVWNSQRVSLFYIAQYANTRNARSLKIDKVRCEDRVYSRSKLCTYIYNDGICVCT